MPFFFCKIGLWLCGRPVSCARIRKRQEKVSLKPFQRLAERETASRGLLASASAGKIRKTSQWDVFLRKPSPGVFLTPSPTAGGYHLSRLKSPLSACNERRGISTACVVALPARLCQRAAHAFAGRAGWIAENLRRASGSVREPRRGFPTKSLPQEAFLPSCVCRRRLRPQGRCPLHPTAFEKAGKTFTCLAKTQARAFRLASLRKPPKAAGLGCRLGRS